MIKNKGNLARDHTDECKRCGTCCRKGGPAFHQDDKGLIDDGIIQARYLYTIRQHEPAYDNVQGHLKPVPSDIIKIKSKQKSSTCVFYHETHHLCKIYKHRPMECRVLKCWDTLDIEEMYQKDRLTRKDLISGIQGLWELVKDHHQRCEYTRIQQLVTQLSSPNNNHIIEQIVKIIEYDTQLRKLVVKTGEMDSKMLDFIFGRPLTRIIKLFGLRLRKEEGKSVLVKTN